MRVLQTLGYILAGATALALLVGGGLFVLATGAVIATVSGAALVLVLLIMLVKEIFSTSKSSPPQD